MRLLLLVVLLLVVVVEDLMIIRVHVTNSLNYNFSDARSAEGTKPCAYSD